VTPLLSIEEASWATGATSVLDGVSLTVQPGELVALMGRNGAGKSTLVDLVAGLRQPTGGRIRLDGRPAEAWSARERARLVAHLPQAVRADLPFSAEQLVTMGRYPQADGWFESDADREAVASAMERTHCRDFGPRAVATLSGGERQRVLLAACLAQEPRLLLLDEPSTFLDVDQQLQCFTLLREEVDRGVACLAVTHDLNLALTFATRIVVLAAGRVAADLAIAEALAQTDWLALFSPRLSITRSESGRPWVHYT
jgi:iron complex transport system ATP-binding protein